MKTVSKLDVYQGITNQIIAAIEAGAGNYQMPWNSHLCFGSAAKIPHNPVGRYSYRGINILSLWSRQQASSYPTAEWATFRQWQSVGGQVRKGERGTLTVFYKTIETASQDTSENKNPQTHLNCFVARAAYVFNAAQVHGYVPTPLSPVCEADKHAASEHLIQASGAKIILGGTEAYYAPHRDEIHLPPHAAFFDLQAFYGVAFHELCHWTGHETRCARNLAGRFGGEAYAIEELVAELGAAFLCAEVGIAAEPRFDHACYISSWLKVLKDDQRAIFAAAAKASEAATFLTSLASANNGATLIEKTDHTV